MKRSLVIIILLVLVAPLKSGAQIPNSLAIQNGYSSYSVQADSFLSIYQQNYPTDTGESSNLNAFRREVRFLKDRVCNNAPVGASRIKPIAEAWLDFMRNKESYCSNVVGYTGNWKPMGPFSNFWQQRENNGRIESIWVDPDDRNIILAGAHTGGLWRTNNGGQNWVNITDGNVGSGYIPGTVGIKSIAVNPQNKNHIYIACSQDRSGMQYAEYGLGLAYSTDGGNNWSYDINFNATANFFDNKFGGNITKLAFEPGTENLVAVVDRYVYLKAGAGNWQLICSLNTGMRYSDFHF